MNIRIKNANYVWMGINQGDEISAGLSGDKSYAVFYGAGSNSSSYTCAPRSDWEIADDNKSSSKIVTFKEYFGQDVQRIEFK